MPEVELNLSMDSISLNYQGTPIQYQFYTQQNLQQRQRGKCHNAANLHICSNHERIHVSEVYKYALHTKQGTTLCKQNLNHETATFL